MSEYHVQGHWDERKSSKFSLNFKSIIDLSMQYFWSDVVQTLNCSWLKSKQGSGDHLVLKRHKHSYALSRQK